MATQPQNLSNPPSTPPLSPEETLPTRYDLPSEDLQELESSLEETPLPPKETLPTMYDLPSEYPGDPGLPDEFHLHQSHFLRQTCRSPLHPPNWMFIAIDINLYYDARNTLRYKRPDWFVAVGVPRLWNGTDMRYSYVTWHESSNPLVVVELLSPGTAKEDLGEAEQKEEIPSKWEVYEQILRIPYYIVYDRRTSELRFFRLVGARYQEQPLNINPPQIWIPELALGLGLWQGDYEGISRVWLRWCDEEGNWIPTDAEAESQRAEAESQRAEAESQRAEAESQRAEAESQRAEVERQRAERLAERLRQLGIDPEED
ncbi:MAG: Uma2 family endonuclease [Cyanobacteriota bacterium]|nr:Uma2 family endonuclease [Cyanobacteriota bacterium]